MINKKRLALVLGILLIGTFGAWGLGHTPFHVFADISDSGIIGYWAMGLLLELIVVVSAMFLWVFREILISVWDYITGKD